MDVSVNSLFLYDDIRRLLFDNNHFTCFDLDNAPMNRRPIKLHKGIDNHLKFRAFDPDRKPVSLISCSNTIYARFISADTKRVVLEKKCKIGSVKGVIFLDVLESESTLFESGFYNLVILASKPYNGTSTDIFVNSPLYTDYDSNINLTVEVTDQAQRDPLPSEIILEKDLTLSRNTSDLNIEKWYSSSVFGNRISNMNGINTFSVNFENYFGKIYVYGTLSESPQPDPLMLNEWFLVSLVDGSKEISCENFSGTSGFSFKSNVTWYKFLVVPDPSVDEPGKVKKILARS